jgi:uncharacterized protein YecE (DUF72 family)
MWWKGDAASRYMYLYSEVEITQLAKKVNIASKNAVTAFAFFNNHWKAYAPRNAVDLKKALQLPFVGFPGQSFLGQE